MRSDSHSAPQPERIEFLAQVRLFADVPPESLRTLAQDLRSRKYGRDDIIFHQGDYGYTLYVVKEGKVRIFKTSKSGNETSINVFVPRDVIGEFSVIDGEPRSATARAITDCLLLEMPRDRFLEHVRRMPELAMALARLLTAKVRWTADYAEAVAQFDAARRLLHVLLQYNEQFGVEIEAGKRYELDLGLNQSDLASLVGTQRAWTNRLLAAWRRRGLIAYEDGKITILDLPAVERELDRG